MFIHGSGWNKRPEDVLPKSNSKKDLRNEKLKISSEAVEAKELNENVSSRVLEFQNRLCNKCFIFGNSVN